MRSLFILIFVVSLPCIAQPAHAGALDEVRLGVLAQSVGGYSPDVEQGAGINLEAVFAAPRILRPIGAPRPLIGASIATDGDATSQIYSSLEWRVAITKRIFASAAGGVAVHNGRVGPNRPISLGTAPRDNEVFLGCRVLMRFGVDLGAELTDRLSVMAHWQHISNAGLCDENEGLDNIGLRFGYGF